MGTSRSRFQTKVSGLPEGFDIDQPRHSLGFKVIRGLVRQLQGHLTVTSNKPKGAHFLLDLPILPKS
jgi:sensor histidine kinase regulating citrate/malate metabolism